MDEEMKARLTSRNVWMRALYMIILMVAHYGAMIVLGLVVVFQFLVILFTGSANAQLLRLGQNLTRYIADILRFETFNSEDRPFPFSDWPDEEPGGERWMEPDPPATGGISGEKTASAVSSAAPETPSAAPETSSTENPSGKPEEDKPGQ